MRWVCLSDTHGHHDRLEIPDGDVLVHAGDMTRKGGLAETEAFLHWFAGQPHPHKILVAGNHDFAFQDHRSEARKLVPPGIAYLEDQECRVVGLRVWGSPWQPWFHDWAFNLPRGQEIRAKWALIPEGVDVLITHGPPFGILDHVPRQGGVGCEDLLARVLEVRPRMHVFGHIHEGHGQTERDGIRFVNASICDEAYRAVHPPLVLGLADRPA